MADIVSFPVSKDVFETDLLLGTRIPPIDSGVMPSTKNFTIRSIAEFIGTNTPTNVAPKYAQMRLVPTSLTPIVFNAVGVWQPLGLVPSLEVPSPGFSLGVTDKCAFRNISGTSKTINVVLDFGYNVSGEQSPVVALALNGVVISNSQASVNWLSYNINWTIEIQAGDEISTYIKSNGVLSYNSVMYYKMNVFQI